jgi:hypothetical protein
VKQKDSAEITRRLAELHDELERTVPDTDRAYRNMYDIAEGR